jgi:1-acyl-sn-glycerol-3-phosphate acyltransferase
MALLRSVIYLLWQIVTVVPYAIATLVASIFVRGDPLYWICVQWLRLVVWGAKVFCGIETRVQGMEHVPDSPIILCPKHQSAWETLAFPTLMPHPLCYVFKRELLWVPFFGWAIGRLDMIHIDRSKRNLAWSKVAEQGRRFMAHGNWVIMFPEGTRIPRGQQGAYKTGASRLAVATDTPILPIAVASARCWPKNSFIKYPGVIDVSIGPPIPVNGRDADELMREVEKWIEAEMRRIDPGAYADASAVSLRG